MNIESLIGIVGGIISIVTAMITIGIWVCKRYKKQSLTGLMKQLVDNKMSQEEHRKTLKKIKFFERRVSDEYIQDFALNNRKLEEVFKDICVKNNIEPTTEICKKFLGYDSRITREYYNNSKKEQQ
jgi:hypothetical protein